MQNYDDFIEVGSCEVCEVGSCEVSCMPIADLGDLNNELRHRAQFDHWINFVKARSCAFGKVSSCLPYPQCDRKLVMVRDVTVKDTDKSKNIVIEFGGDLTLDQMENVLSDAGENLELIISHITTLSQKRYPGNRHWHFKEAAKSKGCLDVTFWPEGSLFWITVRNYEPEWVHKAGHDLAVLLKKKLTSV